MEDYAKDISELVNTAVDKAKELGNSAKLRALITAEEAKIREQYYQLGKKYYKLYNDTPETDLSDIVDEIRSRKNKIAKYKEDMKRGNDDGADVYEADEETYD